MRDFQQPGRSAAYAANGMVATSHPDAARVGVEVLRAGGNAADAAIAASAVLAVVEPQNAGLGGDTFWIHARGDGAVSAWNGSGRTPAALDAEALGQVGQDSVHSVTVPGAVDALVRLHEAHARLPLDRLLAPAIAMARDGAPVQPRVAWDWVFGAERLGASATTRGVWGQPPRVGDRFVQPALAATLEAIAAGGAAAFYEGACAERLVATLRALGGYHTLEDFARHRGEAVTPIATRYRGHDILECPPNGQGMTVLLMLNVLSGLDMAAVWHERERWIHLLAQLSQAAYAERDRWICDPDFARVPIAQILSAGYADRMRARLDPERAQRVGLIVEPEHKDTVFLACVDADGNAISFINSIFTDFGSAIYDAGSGLLLHNRGASFAPWGDHPNALAPGKRPMHTIIPAMAMRNGRAVMPFGVMGGHYQAAGQVQLVSALFDAGLDPQQAFELPRHFAYNGVLELEHTVPEGFVRSLAARGWRTARAARPMGGGQAVMIDHERGVLCGGTDPRKDGHALGY